MTIRVFTLPMVHGGVSRISAGNVVKSLYYMSRISDAVPNWARNLIAVACLCWIVYVGLMVYQLREFSHKVVISQQDRVIEERVHLLITKAEGSELAYLMTGNDEYLRDYYSSVDQLHANFRTLVVYLKANPVQYATLGELNKAISSKLDGMEANIKAYKAQGHVDIAKIAASDKGLVVTHQIEDLINTLTAEERNNLRRLNVL